MSEYKRQIAIGGLVALVATLGFAFELANYNNQDVSLTTSTVPFSSGSSSIVSQTTITPNCPLDLLGCLHQTAEVKIAILEGASANRSVASFSLPPLATLAAGGNNSSISSPTGFNIDVLWINNDTVPHDLNVYSGSISCPEPKLVANSGEIYPGMTFAYTFSSLGTFSYQDNSYIWMKGSLNIVYQNQTSTKSC